MASRGGWWRVVVGLLIFGVAFGYVEAAVVAYLRAMYAPLRAHFYPTAPAGELFPLLTLDQLRVIGPEHATRLETELGREFATLAMLAGVALIAARSAREWIAAFAVSFGVWDIAFYLSLKLLLNWPASLFTWDILFLLWYTFILFSKLDIPLKPSTPLILNRVNGSTSQSTWLRELEMDRCALISLSSRQSSTWRE